MDGASQIELVPADHLRESSQQASVQSLIGVQLKQGDGLEIEVPWDLHTSNTSQATRNSFLNRLCPDEDRLSQQQVTKLGESDENEYICGLTCWHRMRWPQGSLAFMLMSISI